MFYVKKPHISKKDTSWIFDPTTETERLNEFIKDISTYSINNVILNLQSGTLTIKSQSKKVNINRNGIIFLLLLLKQSSNLVTNEKILEITDSQQIDNTTGVAIIRKELFIYLKSIGFSQTSLKYLKDKIINQEKIGYKISISKNSSKSKHLAIIFPHSCLHS